MIARIDIGPTEALSERELMTAGELVPDPARRVPLGQDLIAKHGAAGGRRTQSMRRMAKGLDVEGDAP